MRYKLLIILILTGLVISGPVFSYDDLTTHPALTDEIVDFYNLFFDEEITEEEKEWIIDGAMSEDTPPRWINHFYDPINKVGWSGEKTGIWPAFSIKYFSSKLLSNNAPVSSLNWLHNYNLQSEYGLYEGDHTWERALYEYANGNEKEAYYTLGFILHLIEDATVPDHTRNDTHAHELEFLTGDYGSPYEEYSKTYTRNTLNIAKDLKNSGFKPVIKNSIDGYLISLAEYSNKYFFSKDTINNENNKEYEFPKIIKEDNNFGYGNDKNNEEFPLVRKEVVKEEGEFKIKFSLKDASEKFILNQYFTRLSREAVINGAGVIDLFHREAEAIKSGTKPAPTFSKSYKMLLGKVGTFLLKNTYNPIGATLDAVNMSVFGEGVKVLNGIKNILSDTFVAQTSSVLSSVEPQSTLQIKNPTTTTAEAVPPPLATVASAPVAPDSSGDLSDTDLASLQYQLDQAQATIISLQNQASHYQTDNLNNNQDNEVVAVNNLDSNSDHSPAPYFSVAYSGFGGGGGAPVSAPAVTPPANSAPQQNQEPEEDQDTQNESTQNNNNDNSNLNIAEEDLAPPDAPIITSPSDFSKVFTTSTIIFQGTAEIASIVSTDFDNATTTVDSTGSWQLALVLPQSVSAINFFATDISGNVSSSTQISLSVDSVSPDISLSIIECENSLALSGCLTKSSESNISWSSSASDLDYFTINSNGVFATTTATSTVVALSENSIFSFGVSARDKAGNISATSTETISTFNSPVVINEVAWAGNQDHPNDEWIELYNNTDYDIPLDKWILEAEDGAPYIPLSGLIKAKDYYLIERSDDDTISDITADLIAPFSGAGNGSGLSNGGEVLMLSYKENGQATTTVDKTILSNNGKWLGGSTHEYQTMERVDTLVSGEDGSNWGTNNSLIVNGKNASGYNIKGTPKSKNSLSYLIASYSDISEDIILTKAKSPYVVDNQWKVFKDGASLTIEPGVVIKFYNKAGLKFENASIIANGTPEEPIVFTSFYDDEHGGDTNNNATSTVPRPGVWLGVDIEGDMSGRSVLNNTIFRYGGLVYKTYGPSSYYPYSNLRVIDSSVAINNSTFEYSDFRGVATINSDVIITDNIFRENSNNVSIFSSRRTEAVSIDGGDILFKDNTVEGSGKGLYIKNASGVVDSNIFKSNDDEAVFATGILPRFSGNSASGNRINGIVIYGKIAVAGATTTLVADPLPYVMDRADVTVPENSAIVIEKGVVMKSLNAALKVGGSILIEGEKPSDVILTSLYDDTIFPRTIANATTTTSDLYQRWYGIHILKGGSMNARGFTVRYTGGGSYMDSTSGITIEEGNVKITDALFSNNYPFGLLSKQSSDLIIENSVFKDHNLVMGSSISRAGLAIYNSSTTLTNLLFEDNAIGILADTVSTFTTSLINFVGNTNAENTSPENLLNP